MATDQGNKYKFNYDVHAAPHKFKIESLNDSTSLGKNSKLSPNWTGPYDIIDINDNNTKIKIKNNSKWSTSLELNLFWRNPPPVFLKMIPALLRAHPLALIKAKRQGSLKGR